MKRFKAPCWNCGAPPQMPPPFIAPFNAPFGYVGGPAIGGTHVHGNPARSRSCNRGTIGHGGYVPSEASLADSRQIPDVFGGYPGAAPAFAPTQQPIHSPFGTPNNVSFSSLESVMILGVVSDWESLSSCWCWICSHQIHHG